MAWISTPIFYVNADPHLGHAFSLILADALTRTRMLLNLDTRLMTGTDEHGLKVYQAAVNNNTLPATWCDVRSKVYRNLAKEYDCNVSRFIRTTEIEHRTKVIDFWNKLYSKGDIYPGTYKGWYSSVDECFTSKVKRNENGKMLNEETGNAVEWIEEKTFYFSFSKYYDRVMEWIDKSDAIYPKKTIIAPNQDLCISRPIARVPWGIPVPNESSQVIYVWFDALINYLTVCGSDWPCHTHVIGKDIEKFHCVYWPAFLMAANLKLPNRILIHSHWTVDGKKMSKSLGNGIDPFDLCNRVGSDAVRYFLLKTYSLDSDADFSMESLETVYTNELSNRLGNLITRIASFKKFTDRNEKLKSHSEMEANLLYAVDKLPSSVLMNYEKGEFSKGIVMVQGLVQQTNKLITDTEPWVLAKNSQNIQYLTDIMNLIFHSVKVISILLLPITPKAASKALLWLGVSGNFNDISRPDLTNFPEKPMLFKKL